MSEKPVGDTDPHESGLQLKIGTDTKNGAVVIGFGKPIEWLGMKKDEALRFAELIISNAKKIP